MKSIVSPPSSPFKAEQKQMGVLVVGCNCVCAYSTALLPPRLFAVAVAARDRPTLSWSNRWTSARSLARVRRTSSRFRSLRCCTLGLLRWLELVGHFLLRWLDNQGDPSQVRSPTEYQQAAERRVDLDRDHRTAADGHLGQDANREDHRLKARLGLELTPWCRHGRA